MDNFGTSVGLAAGVATSLLWTATSLFFTAAGRRISPTLVNASRIVLAIGLLGITHRLVTGQWIPSATYEQVVLLGVSGVVGLAIGDQALFVAFVDIGPRLCLLIMATSPLWAALFGWIALGETIDGGAWLGIALVLGGVIWVATEKPTKSVAAYERSYRVRGIALAILGSVCQAGGLLLSKQGIGHGMLAEAQHMTPQAATLVRMVFAAVGMVPILLIARRREASRRASGLLPSRVGSPTAGLVFMACGAVVGPFLGVWMSLVALDRAPLGIAQTLCSLSPIFILPFAVLIEKERLSLRAIVGALLAVAGTVVVFARS